MSVEGGVLESGWWSDDPASRREIRGDKEFRDKASLVRSRKWEAEVSQGMREREPERDRGGRVPRPRSSVQSPGTWGGGCSWSRVLRPRTLVQSRWTWG